MKLIYDKTLNEDGIEFTHALDCEKRFVKPVLKSKMSHYSVVRYGRTFRMRDIRKEGNVICYVTRIHAS